MQKSIHLAFCTDGIFPHKVGGIQRHSRLLIEHLADYQDLEITVIHPHEENIFGDFSNISELKVTDINKNKTYLFELYRYSKRVAHHLSKLDPDVIYAQGFTVWSSIDRFKDRLIINPHGLEPWQALSYRDKIIGLPFRRIQKHLFSKAEKTVSLGGRLTEILEGIIPDKKIAVLPNAVSGGEEPTNKKFPNPDESAPIKTLFVGRFASNKGIHILIDAISQLNEEGFQNKFDFHLAGKGPLYEEYKEQHRFGNVKYWGFVSDEQLEELYDSSHLFVLPTLFEGMPTVVLEAMVKQLPIIVTDTGATAEQVDELNGFLIQKNNVSELKKALLKFHDLQSDKKNKMGLRSHQKVLHNFTWEKVAEKHYQVFKRIQKNSRD